MQASGHIKEYHLPVESITLMCFPLTWIFFYFDLPAYSVFVSMIAVCLIAHIVRLFCLRRYYCYFSIKKYMLSFAFPAIIILIVISIISSVCHSQIESSLWSVILSFLYIPLLVFLAAYAVGINKEERQLLASMIQVSIIQKICRK